MANLYLAKAVAAYDRGMACVEDGDVAAARDAFAEAVRLQPDYLEAKLALGNATMQLGDMAAGLHLLEEALRSAPDNPAVLASVGLAHLLTGDEARALEYWEHLIRTTPELPVEIALDLGQLLMTAGYPELARDLVTPLLEHHPRNAKVLATLGLIDFDLENFDSAEELAYEAMGIDEACAVAHHLRGLLAMLDDEYPTAVEAFRRVRELDPDSEGAGVLLARALLENNQKDEALAMTNSCLAREELDDATIINCAQLLFEAGRPAEAVAYIQDLLRADPANTDAAYTLLSMASYTRNLDLIQWIQQEVVDPDPELQEAIAITAGMLKVERGLEPQSPRKKRRTRGQENTANAIYQLRLELRGLRPPIWRRLLVSGDTTLWELHRIIQTVMNWDDSHLHEFVADAIHYGNGGGDDIMMSFYDEVEDEHTTTLAEVAPREKDKFTYTYDFGNNWEILITVMHILPPDPNGEYPICQTGKRAAPTEDCGGVWGYADLLEMLADPNHPGREEYPDWIEELTAEQFDPEAFDVEEVNARLRKQLGSLE